MKSFLVVLLLLVPSSFLASAQSFYQTNPVTIPVSGSDVYDTLQVAGLSPAMINAAFGLDSVSLNITYPSESDLVISIIAPDGTIVHLSDYFGSGPDFVNTCFTMHVTNFANDQYSPFTGTMQPSEWLGRINNGQPGNGKWILHVVNAGFGTDTGIILNWGITFDSTPAPQPFFDSSTLPIVVVNTYDIAVPAYFDVTVAGYMGIIDNGTVNHLSDPFNGYNGHANFKVRGNSSRSFPTKAFAVTTVDSTGAQIDASLLGMPADHSWILYAPWDDKSLIRDVITYETSNDMGEYAARTRLCELYMNNDYRGVYVLEEHISRGAQRVAVHKMTTTDTAAPNVTGGYIFEVDRGSPGYDAWSSNILPCDSAASSITFAYAYPKSTDIVNQQKQYIAAYTDSFEQALKNLDLYDTVHGYRNYIDVPSFIDQSLLQELGHNVDGYRLSSYLHKNRSGKLFGGPIWDFNESFGNSDYYNGWATNTWEWDLPCPFSDGYLNPFWWKQFLTDTNYVHELKCRYTSLRSAGNALDTLHLDHMIDSLVDMLEVPQQRHYLRWPIMGVYTWPNYFVGTSYAEEINYLKTWIGARITWMDSTLIDTSCNVTPPVTGITPPERGDIKVYPSPTDNIVNINGNVLFTNVQVFNMLGQLVYSNNTPTTHLTIELRKQGCSSGIYNIIISSSTGIVRKKITVSP